MSGNNLIQQNQKECNYNFPFEISEYFFKLLFSEKPSEDEIVHSSLNQILLECAKYCIFDDTALGLSFLLSVKKSEMCEQFFNNLSYNPLSYQIAMYFYGLARYINENKDFINVPPKTICQYTLENDNSFYHNTLMKYKLQNDNYRQAQTAIELNCGIDSNRFISDIDYRRDTIFGLAMSLDLEKVLVAIRLAEQNNMCPKEMAIVHVVTFLMEHSSQPLEKLQTSLDHPTISALLKKDPVFAKNRLSSIFDNMNGCDFSKLIMYFTILHAIDGDSPTLCCLTPKQQIKLIKKVKATSPAINYIDLITHKYDLLTILQPALTNDNFNNVVRLVKNLPESVRGDFNPNVLYRKRAVEEFFYTVREVTSMKQCLKIIKGIFNKWLNKVDVSDIQCFIEQTVLCRETALTLDYEYRKQILLALVSRACWRVDYSENMRYLTCLIQERLDIMDKVWDDTDLEISFTKCLKNYLFDIEAAVGNEAKLIEIMKNILLDQNLTKDDVLVAYKASGVSISLNSLISSLQESDNSNEETIITRKKEFWNHSTLEKDYLKSETDENEHPEKNHETYRNVVTYQKLWPTVLIENSDNTTQIAFFEKLLSVTNTTEQIIALNTMLQNLTFSEDLPDIHLLQVRLLHKLVNIKSNEKFTLIAKLMDEASLNKKEILELVNKTKGDALTQAWICILGNNPELEILATEFLSNIDIEEVKSIVYKMKTIPWDVVKALACSSCYKKIIDVIFTIDESGSATEDVIKVLKEIHLTSEASSLNMSANSTPETLRSFNTALLFFTHNK